MTALAIGAHDPDAVLPSLGDVFNVACGPASQAVAVRTSEVRKHFSEVLMSQSSTWVTIFESEFPTLAHGLGDPDRPAYTVDHLTRSELLSIPDLGVVTRGVRLPPATD